MSDTGWRLLDDGALAAALAVALGEPVAIRTRAVLQERRDGHRPSTGRVVERVRLDTGRYVVVKCRNDRPVCRETLFYRHALFRAGSLAPTYLGGSTVPEGVHVLVLEDVAGRPPDWAAPRDLAQVARALASFHARFEGATLDLLLAAAPELGASPLAGELAPSASAPDVADDPATERDPIDPLVLDPGDLRPENVLLAPRRVVLLDFENTGVRRRSVALSGLLVSDATDPDEPERWTLAAAYARHTRVVSRYPSTVAELARRVGLTAASASVASRYRRSLAAPPAPNSPRRPIR
jgi:hypothetical protein